MSTEARGAPAAGSGAADAYSRPGATELLDAIRASTNADLQLAGATGQRLTTGLSEHLSIIEAPRTGEHGGIDRCPMIK